jgi:hypothetical protein
MLIKDSIKLKDKIKIEIEIILIKSFNALQEKEL